MEIVKDGVMDFLDANEIGILLLQWYNRDIKEHYSACKEVVRLIEQQQKLNYFIDSTCGSKIRVVDNCEKMRKYLAALLTFDETRMNDSILKVIASKCSQGGNIQAPNTYSLYIYSPRHDRWYSKDITMPDDTIYSFIGATKDCLVFQKKSGNIVIGLFRDQSTCIEWLEPSLDGGSPFDVAYHVWEGNLVMIRGCSQETSIITVFCYDFRSRIWNQMGTLCSMNMNDEIAFQLNCCSFRDTLYVIITTNNGHICLLKLRRGCKFWKLFRLHRLPQLIWHGCQNVGFQVIRVDSGIAAPNGTTAWHRHGYVFMDVVGEYLTKCWRGVGDPLEPHSFIWLEVSPMPAETLHSFSSCEVHSSILQHFNRPNYKGKKDGGGTRM